MSTAPLPGSYPASHPSHLRPQPLGPSQLLSTPGQPDLNQSLPPAILRRRASMEQGRALEILGHAVEYLVDSRMFMIELPASKADTEATRILMRLSREVFADCGEIIPPSRRLRLWVNNRFKQPEN